MLASLLGSFARLRPLISAAGVAALCSPVFAEIDDTTFDRYVTALSQTIDSTPTRADLVVLSALRALEDPALTPLFSQLVSADAPALRLQGILGLAELSTPRQLDLVLMASAESPADRALILGQGLEAGLVGAEQLNVILRWPQLDPKIELAVLAQLIGRGERVDNSRIDRLARSESMDVRLGGELLRMALSDDPGPIMQTIEAELEGIEESDRRRHVAILLDLIDGHELVGASVFLEWSAEIAADEPPILASVQAVWLRLSPETAAPAWQSAFRGADSIATKFRLAIAALRGLPSTPPEVFETIAGESDPALSVIGAAGGSVSRGAPDLESLVALASTNYEPAIAWMLETAKDWPASTARELLLAMILRAESRTGSRSPLALQTVIAIVRLAEIDGESLRPVLDRALAREDQPMISSILAGLLSGGHGPIWDVDSPPTWPNRQTRALALLCSALSGSELSAEESDTLARIPLGWGDLTVEHRMQATWLAATREGRGAELLARSLSRAAQGN